MGDWRLVGKDGAEDVVSDAGQLAQRLRELSGQRTDKPFIMQLTGPSGTLAFGVGRAATVLNHIPANGDPPYHESRGAKAPGDVVVYFFGGDWTEFGTEAEISWDAAQRALIDYYATSRLASFVKWAEV